MNRGALILSGLLVGLLGVLTHYAIPWTVTDASNASGTTEHFTYARLAESGFPFEEGGSNLSFGLTLVLHGFTWGMAFLAVAQLALLARSYAPPLAAAFALLGSLAPVVSLALFAVGGTLFGTELAQLSSDTAGFANIGFGLNYATPVLALLFLGVCAAQAVDATREFRQGLEEARAASPYAPYDPARAAATPATSTATSTAAPTPSPTRATTPATATPPAPAVAVTPAPMPASTPAPLARERTRALERVAQGRDHARRIARGTDDPAMATWLRQTEAYLSALEKRARDAQDAATLAAVERDVEEHVLRHG